MSSIYNKRIRKSPPSYFFTKTCWSAWVLWKPRSTVKDSNFLYHCWGACFSTYKLFLSRHTKFSFLLKLFKLMDVDLFLQISMQKGCFNIQLLYLHIHAKLQCSTQFSSSQPERALYLGGFPFSLGFSLYTHLFLSAFFLFGNLVSSYVCFSCQEPFRLSWHNITPFCGL